MDARLGSLSDQVQGFISGIKDGVHTPPTVLQQIPGVADTLVDTTVRAHNAHVDTTNGLYGTNFQHFERQGGNGGQSGMIRARDAQGKLHEAPAGTALPTGWKLEK